MAEYKTKKLGIFCFFDKDGVVDSYIEFLLSDLSKCITKLVVVINGYITSDGRKIFEKYTKNIIIRENKGYDIAALREGILSECRHEKIDEWDEILFCNDTFYGPFVSFSDIFNRAENVDFWGLNIVEEGMFTHLQSYFLAFRTQAAIKALLEYLNDKDHSFLFLSNDIRDIYAVYELGLFRFLVRKGLTYASYANTQGYSIYSAPDECICRYNLPILKKKCFSPQFYSEKAIENVMAYIAQKSYDVSYIMTNAERNYGVKNVNIPKCASENYPIYKIENQSYKCIDEKVIELFIQDNRDIYIYGIGVYARKIWYLFHKVIPNFCGFIISDNCEITESTLYGSAIIHYSDKKANGAIIIGCDEKNTREIICQLRHDERFCTIWQLKK